MRLSSLLPRRLPAGVEAAPGAEIGRGVRFRLSAGARVVLAPGARIGDGSRIEVARGGEVRIGAGARLGERVVISASGRIVVGPGVVTGDDVLLTDSSRATGDVERPLRRQDVISAPVEIGEGAVLGVRAAVLPGVTIGPRAVLEAGSVADRDVPADAVVSGVPARAAPRRSAPR